MLRSFLSMAILCLAAAQLQAVQPIDHLPKDVQYDPAIPTPKGYLGFEIGDRHVQHHELVGYVQAIAAASERATFRQYGRTYGNRPLVMLTITSPENHKRLDELQKLHSQLADPARSEKVDLASLPIVINMGYSVHGNEASGGNAALLVAYYLAGARGAAITSLLRDAIILLDPCLNPDGFQRFAHWVNDHRGAVPNQDPDHLEHQEGWPSGRTNYYWFDLNRDWLPLQHPESQGRMSIYRQWRPNVVLDFHEMGTNGTFFFQPGVPQRTHPLIPQSNVELTEKIGAFHAKALDKVGALYYTEEGFDDFYPGKGSTYPDLHGAIGILFEQASSRGYVQDSAHGPLTFAFTVRNQLLASLSSLEAARTLRLELLEHMRQFYRDSMALARNDAVQGYVFAAPHDPARLCSFLQILERHGVEAHALAEDLKADGRTFHRGSDYVVLAQQPEYQFLKSLFEKRTQFEESIFYDVSAWTLPLAFGLQWAELKQTPSQGRLGSKASSARFPRRTAATDQNDLAYLIDWRGYYSPRALYRFLSAGVKVKAAQRAFQVDVDGRSRDFGYGTLLIPLGIQREKAAQIRRLVQTAAREDAVEVFPAKAGLTAEGPDLGSSSFAPLKQPKVLLVAGEGVSSSEAGEVWHLLDQRFRMPLTLVDPSRTSAFSLDDYTTVVMVSGSYQAVSNSAVENLKRWISEGGVLIAIGSAAGWVDQKEIVDLRFRTQKGAESDAEDKSSEKRAGEKRRPYVEASRDAALRAIPGAIFETHVDITHPIGYGYQESRLPVFRRSRTFLEPAEDAYATPVIYSSEPLMSGYISRENLESLAGSASVVVRGRGGGKVIVIIDDPNFRGFWYGANRVFLNSVFFGSIIR